MIKSLPLLYGFIGAVLGGVILIIAIHIYQDHQSLHAIINMIVQQQQQQQSKPAAATENNK